MHVMPIIIYYYNACILNGGLVIFIFAVTDCGDLEPPANGSVSVPSTNLSAVATYSCDDGHELIGESATRVCTESGVWSNSTVECRCEFE